MMFYQKVLSLTLLVAANVADAALRNAAVDAAGNTASGIDRNLSPDNSKSGKSIKSGKSDKSSKSSKSGKSAKSTQAPTSAPTTFLQPGFELGMLKEVEGYWVGEEKFANEECGGPFDYCSTAIFDPRGPTEPENFLIFQSAYVGANGRKGCKNAGVDYITGDIDGNWLRKQDPFNYILQLEQKKCLTAEECPYNVVTESGFFDNYTILKQSCGAHLKVDRLTLLNNCELFQVNLLEENTTKELIVVSVLSYSGAVEGYGNVVCPTEPTFDLDTLAEDTNMDGMLLFVKQGCIAENCTVTGTEDWECALE